jgi:UDP:flavonoid glycosyltransferase YjiC (YdhE family)
MRVEYARISEVYERGRSVLVGHFLSFAARVFEEVHGAPAATLQLAPSAFRSDYGQPAFAPGRDPSGWPRWLKRALWWAIDRFMIDPLIVPELNRWRGEFGLPPMSRIFKAWVHSPQRVIGLFPPWFGPPQPDWPPQRRLTGFPLYDEAEQHVIDPALRTFLDEGDPPLLFTPGTANRAASAFFAAGVDASEHLGRRALLLTRYPEQISTRLPSSIRHFAYAPFSKVLPRCAAIVHHGGIGTCAQGLAAGIPQLTMPLGFDQPDNVTRLWKLGVGRWVPPRRFTGPRVATALAGLLDNARVADACRRWADDIRRNNAVGGTCDLLEQLRL